MGTDIKVRIANHDDIEGIVELQKYIYPDHKRDRPFFTWQCFENDNPSILIVAQEDASIIGMLGIQKIPVTGIIYGGQLSWIVVAEHRRGRGLFANMGRLALDCMPDLDLLFIFANKAAIYPCEKTFGMNFIGNMEQLISRYSSSDIYTESSVAPINITTTFNSISCCEGTITFLRTEPYRRWRYAKSTVYRYFKVSIPSGEYAIIKLFDKRGSEQIIGDIVDYECNSSDISRLHRLFQAALFELRKMGATSVTTWGVPGSQLRLMLGEMGFVQSDHSSSFGIKIFNHKHNYLSDFSRWHLVQSDASNY